MVRPSYSDFGSQTRLTTLFELAQSSPWSGSATMATRCGGASFSRPVHGWERLMHPRSGATRPRGKAARSGDHASACSSPLRSAPDGRRNFPVSGPRCLERARCWRVRERSPSFLRFCETGDPACDGGSSLKVLSPESPPRSVSCGDSDVGVHSRYAGRQGSVASQRSGAV